MPTNDVKHLLFESIDEIGKLYRSKEVSPVEVTAATLERLHELEPQLNAFVTVLDDQAMAKAKAAEALFAKGTEAGRLVGIPVSIKDIFTTKGIRTSLGSRILKDHVPDTDAFVYTALKEAGAVIIGKNNMLEFAYGSVHPDYGQCNNPWNVNRTSGGSSTGSASSVAAGIGFASIGTDTGGSIRVPASFCGIVGLKPTYGTVPSQGLFPLSQSLDHIGPLTRTVRDNAIVLEQISSLVFDYETVFSGNIQGVKVGVIRQLMDTVTNPEVIALTTAAIDKLRDLGADVREVDIPGIESIESSALVVVLAEASAVHRHWYDSREADYNPATYANLKAGFGITAVAYLEALETKRRFTAQVDEALKQVDVLVSPTMAYPATEKDPSFEDGNIDVSRRTIPFNYSGHPALSVSSGNTPSENLPVGLQIIGRYHDEAAVYRVADAFQQATGGYKIPPI
ncbi:amidase [Planococcus sp. N028]|uniref:Amidase n=1 Tax=Planococcus shixiaomingii TaxID=3058393 RepID=A0ABT8N4X1_9BACL|nr:MULTISPECIES: amidase [unclassified Planococcus (in: firmicutes)]MDN7242937.1 amidase [Planococcus sp. N028]WKA55439.1 amidase [Planococcus sp. N022]